MMNEDIDWAPTIQKSLKKILAISESNSSIMGWNNQATKLLHSEKRFSF